MICFFYPGITKAIKANFSELYQQHFNFNTLQMFFIGKTYISFSKYLRDFYCSKLKSHFYDVY